MQYFYLTFYRILFLFLFIYKRNTNSVLYLTNELYHYTICTDILIIKNLEIPLMYFLNGLQVLNVIYNYVDYLFFIVQNSFINIYNFYKNQKISLYIENIENNMEQYNIVYLQKRDEFIQTLFKNVISNLVDLLKKTILMKQIVNHLYLIINIKNIKGTINKLKNKKNFIKNI